MAIHSYKVVATLCLAATVAIGSALAQTSHPTTLKQGDAQFGNPEVMYLIGAVSKKWRAAGNAPFSLGDMTLADASLFHGHFPGGDHQTGLTLDMRPIRKDGQNAGVRWDDPDYDREATQRLVDMLNESGQVERIVFSDPQINGTKIYRGLDDHLHVTVKARKN